MRGPSDAVGPLVITDTLPEGMSFVSASGEGWDCAADAPEVACILLGDLPAGTDAPVLDLTVQIDAAVVTDLTNTAGVESSTTDPTPGNNTDDETVQVGQETDLAITKTHEGKGIIGEELNFTLAVTNAGPSDASSVSVTDSLPEGLNYVSATGTGWECTDEGQTVTCTLDELLPAETSANPITITVLVQSVAYPAVENTAAVASETPDPDPENNTSVDEVTVDPLVNLTIGKRHDGEFKVGQQGVFTLEIGNEGPTAAPGPISVTDSLPEGLTFVSATGDAWDCAEAEGTIACEHGELAVSETSLIEVVVSVEPGAYPSVTNVAHVSSDSVETDEDDNRAEDPVTVNPFVKLSLDKQLDSVTRDKASFNLIVTNEGPNNTVGPVTLVDDLPAGLGFESASGQGWDCTAAAQVVTCLHDGTIAVGDTSSVQLVTNVTAAPGAQLTNMAEVSGGGSDESAQDEVVVNVAPSEPTAPTTPPDSGQMPNTGGPSAGWLAAGLTLLAVGGALLVTARRRRA